MSFRIIASLSPIIFPSIFFIFVFAGWRRTRQANKVPLLPPQSGLCLCHGVKWNPIQTPASTWALINPVFFLLLSLFLIIHFDFDLDFFVLCRSGFFVVGVACFIFLWMCFIYFFYFHVLIFQHLYLLPECATQQVCSAVYLRLNYSQPLCACPSVSGFLFSCFFLSARNFKWMKMWECFESVDNDGDGTSG